MLDQVFQNGIVQAFPPLLDRRFTRLKTFGDVYRPRVRYMWHWDLIGGSDRATAGKQKPGQSSNRNCRHAPNGTVPGRAMRGMTSHPFPLTGRQNPSEISFGFEL